MTVTLLIMSAIIGGAGLVPYVIHTMQGTVKPRLVTWSIWAVLSGVLTISAFSGGHVASAVLSLQTVVGSTAVVMLGWRNGSVRIGLIDKLCLLGAVVGVSSLIVFRDPTVALVTALTVDSLAFIPTLIHAWVSPYEESFFCFISGVGAALLTLVVAVMETQGLSGMLYPAYAITFNGAVAALVLIGRGMIVRQAAQLDYEYVNDEAA